MVIAGRVADVDMALGQDDVRALAVAKAGEKGERSRRLALAKEGQIAEGSPAWEGMSAGDRAKRKRAVGERGRTVLLGRLQLTWTVGRLLRGASERCRTLQTEGRSASCRISKEVAPACSGGVWGWLVAGLS